MSTETDEYLSHLGIEVDDEIKHHGVKGMKWGVIRGDNASGGSKGPSRKEKRQAKNDEIEGARDRQRMRAIELERQAFKTYSANGQKAAEAAVRKYDKMEADFLSNPDATTAAKMTSGEKIAAGINWGLAATVIVGAGAIKVAAATRR